MKLNIELEESTQLLKSPVAATSSKCTQVTNDFMGADRYMNKYTINLAQLPPTLKCNQTKNLVISKTFLQKLKMWLLIK